MKETKESKYPLQQCQDDNLTQEFRQFHEEIVNMIADFCYYHDIEIDEFHLSGDDFSESCKNGKWMSSCDSSLEFDKFTKEYKDACEMKTFPSKEEWNEIKARQKPYLFSM